MIKWKWDQKQARFTFLSCICTVGGDFYFTKINFELWTKNISQSTSTYKRFDNMTSFGVVKLEHTFHLYSLFISLKIAENQKNKTKYFFLLNPHSLFICCLCVCWTEYILAG